MNTDLIIDHATVITESAILPDSTVAIGDGRIQRIQPTAAGQGAPEAARQRVDAAGKFLAPGFIDLHIHGTHQYLIDTGPDAVRALCGILPRYGVTGYLPTVCPLPVGQDSEMVGRMAADGQGPGASILGFHLEGPFHTDRRHRQGCPRPG